MTEPIYRRPDDYDLEHEGDTEDIDFFVRLASETPELRRVLEIACGSGRVTLPLAEAGARAGFQVMGLEMEPDMLAEANRRRDEADPPVRERLTLVQGDMRSWRADEPFDLILVPCSSMCHLLSLDDQLAAWRAAYANLAQGGRFVVDVPMPNLAVYAESYSIPPRAILEIDRDTRDPDTGERLIRSKTARYVADAQRAEIRYLYDRIQGDAVVERFVSDYESHVYFHRELQLLFLNTGFHLGELLGDYRGRPLAPTSRRIIAAGTRP